MTKNLLWFSKKLITWYLQNKRDLPWRETEDPYPIWLSEIILQQTRVAQGLPYFEKFVTHFPTVFDLAKASESDVLKLWQGLGYYSRARNLHTTAKYIAYECGGVFPNNYKQLRSLKGVGDYTASAIASICFNESTAVVDGNVYRVLSRVFGITLPINSTQGNIEFKKWAQKLIDPLQPGTYNQAIMEFGAKYCVPSQPNCSQCIFNEKCFAYAKKRVSELPIKHKKTKVKTKYFNFLVCISKEGKTLVEQRTEKGIWQNLYQFPLIETPQKMSLTQLKKREDFKQFLKTVEVQNILKFNDKVIVHKLSHKHLHTTFWIVEVETLSKNGISISEIHKLPVPVLIENFISNFTLFKK
ncbi:MAG: A/G-specific adenine glycosylase [Flavobacteriaceae bacterium]